MDELYSIINIYENFKKKYKDYIKPEIVSISIIQSEEYVLLESMEYENVEGGFAKETVKRIDLGFITEAEGNEEGDQFFNPKDSIESNVKKFIDDYSPYSIMMTTGLFHEVACNKIFKKFKVFGVDK